MTKQMILVVASTALVSSAISVVAAADEKAAANAVGQPVSLSIAPTKIELSGKRARQQLAITGNYSGNEVRDLTAAVEFSSSDPKIVTVENGVARPAGNGTA